MPMYLRRILAGVVGVITVLSLAIWTFAAENNVRRYVGGCLALHVPLSQSSGPRPPSDDFRAQPFYLAFIGALILSGGCVLALRVLTPRPSFSRRLIWYLLFLAILLPASLYNYSQRDDVLSMGVQAGFNLVLIALAAIAAVWLADFRVGSPDTKVIKAMTLVLLIASGVLVPMLFTALWGLNQLGVLSLKQTQEISFAQLTGVSAVGSMVIAWLNYRRGDKHTADNHSANPPIILR